MFKVLAIFVLVFALFNAQEIDISDAEYQSLPKLFHLDDYYSCLSLKKGLYCVGTFELTPDDDDVTYKLLKDLSRNPYSYNRTLLHRGYCVSARCPSSGPNVTLRFEQCAAKWGNTRGLRLKLQKLDYCQTHYDTIKVSVPDISQRMFLYVIYILLLLNVIGTAYDMYRKEGKENKLLMSWSIISNWKRLISSYKEKDPRYEDLTPIQGARVVITVIVIMCHVAITYVMLYIKNVREIEKCFEGLYVAFLINGSSLVQVFVMFSSFLCSYNLLVSSEKKPLTLRVMSKNIIKRIFRISPVHLLLVGYAATWWIHARDGPIWHKKVASQMEICKRKFWSHALFINNIVDSENYCFIQTWFLAVDMQLYIIAIILTVLLSRYNYESVYILAALFIGSCISISILSYYLEWKSALYITFPETLANIFIGVKAFHSFYITPLGYLPASLMGILLAHLHYTSNKEGVKLSNYKWLVYTHNLFLPVYISWLALGYYIRYITTPWFTAMFVGGERIVVNIMSAVQIIGFINIDSFLRRFFSSRIWDPLARLSFSAVMIHWCVNVAITAGRPDPLYTTFFDIISDGASTVMLTYALAVPLSVMVEIPIQRFLDNLIF